MTLTPEARAKAQAGRAAAKAASAHFRRDWADSGLWDTLARNRGIRLPTWQKPPTGRALKSWHRKLDSGHDPAPFEEVYGAPPSRLIQLNPHTPLRAFVGMMLERVR